MVGRRSSASSRSVTSWVMLSLIVLLIVVALVSGGTYLYLRSSSPSRLPGPVQQLGQNEIDPSLALLTLSGVSDLDVVDQTLASHALGTAYAAAFFGTELADGERVGSLLLVGQAYAAAGDKERAQLCYQQADLVLTLSPTVADFAKAKAYLAIGEGLAELRSKAQARSRYDQAYVIALNSPYVKNQYRAEILSELAAAYQALGDSDKAVECSTQQAEIAYASGGEERQESPPAQPVSPLAMEVPEPTAPMVTSYEERRVETVRQLIDFLQGASPGEPISEELMTDVGRALLNEDGARRSTYEQQLAAASSMVLKIGITQTRVDWLLVKYRVALGGYGLELVPAWTDSLADIEAELNAAYGELRAAYDEQISTFSEDGAVDRAWSHLLRFEIQRGRLGLYPDFPQEELVSQLTEVGERLIASGDPSLHVRVLYEGDVPSFTLAAPEQ